MTLSRSASALVGQDRVPSPLDHADSPVAQALRQSLLLGLFLPIQAVGWSV